MNACDVCKVPCDFLAEAAFADAICPCCRALMTDLYPMSASFSGGPTITTFSEVAS